MKPFPVRVFGMIGLLLLGAAPRAAADDLTALILFKAAWYEQSTAEDPTLIPQAQDPYDVTATAMIDPALLNDPDGLMFITGMTLRTPGGRTEAFLLDEASGSFGFYAGAVTSSVLNQRYGVGDYRFTISSVLVGDTTYTVPLAADDYPVAPKITNWSAGQTINAAQDFTLRWVDFVGSGAREIWFDVYDALTYDTVFSVGPLGGDVTSVVIPAGTLQDGSDYEGNLLFTRYTHVATASTPETYSGFDAYNMFPLHAGGGGAVDPATLSAWRVPAAGGLEFTATCTPGRALLVQGTAQLGGPWTNLQTNTPAAATVLITVPAAQLGDRQFLRVFQQ